MVLDPYEKGGHRTDCFPQGWKMQRVTAKRSRDSLAENVTGISEGKKTRTVTDELWEIQCGQLQELKAPWGPSWRGLTIL